MSSFFYQIGRGVGRATIPAIQKSRQLWQNLTGKREDSLRAESEFGQALASELRLKIGLSHEGPDLQLVRQIARKLGSCVRDKRRTFQVEVLLDKSPTAMALPGGFIFISTALVEFCDRTPDELAFLIGHEMGHIVRGHALDRMLRRIGVEGLTAILSRGLLNPVLREAGLKWLQTSHAPDAELEADEFGLRIMRAASYDPTAPLRFLQRLAQWRTTAETTSDYFGTHPPETERIAQINAVLRDAAEEPPANKPGAR